MQELGCHGDEHIWVVSRGIVQGVMGCLAGQVLQWELGVTAHHNNRPPAVEGVTCHTVAMAAPTPAPCHLRPTLTCIIWEVFLHALLLLCTRKGPL